MNYLKIAIAFICVSASTLAPMSIGTAAAQAVKAISKKAISTASHNVRPYGLAVPKNQVTLQSATDGHIAEIRFKEGDFVKQGDIVVALDHRPAAARLKIAKLESEKTGVLDDATAGLAVAQSNFDRMKSLFKQKAAAKQEYLEAGLRLDRAKAAVKIEREQIAANEAKFELAAAELEKYLLRAPFSGQIVQLQTEVGASVSQSNKLIQIVSLDSYRVDLFLPVSTASSLIVGQPTEVVVESPYEQVVSATVLFKSPIIEAATGTTRVSLEIDNRELKLPAGVTISLAKQAKNEG
jgi:RND family efflux transporter MFP subunit